MWGRSHYFSKGLKVIRVIKRSNPNSVSSWSVLESKGLEEMEIYSTHDYEQLLDFLEYTKHINKEELNKAFVSLIEKGHNLIEFGSLNNFVYSGYFWN